jgi:hypothetical protein
MGRKRQFSPEQELELVRLYKAGGTLVGLAQKFGVSETPVRNALLRHIRLRPRNSPRSPDTWTFCACGKRAVYISGLCRQHYDQRRNGQSEVQERRFNWKLRRYFNITREQYDRMLEAQGGICAICRRPERRNWRLAVDHDRKCCSGSSSCGACVRGLLCLTCNTALGSIEEDLESLENMIRYIRADGYAGRTSNFTAPVDAPAR